jgi:hypothetical protein
MIKSIALSMAAATAAALASSIIAAAADMTPKATLMTAGKALELEIGDQHTISYFQPASDGCSLTVVIAAGQTGEGGQEAHGTRINLPIAPGKTVRIDGTQRRSADFVCGPMGKKMNAKVYDREPYKSAAAIVSH